MPSQNLRKVFFYPHNPRYPQPRKFYSFIPFVIQIFFDYKLVELKTTKPEKDSHGQYD